MTDKDTPINKKDPVLLTCSNCETTKPETDFYKNKSRATGRMGQCADCIREMRKERTIKKKAAIKSAILEKDSTRQKLNSENLENMDITKENVIDGKIKHFSALFVAQSESGKTILMMDIIKKLRKYYDMIILVSKNIQAESYDLDKFDFYTNEMFLDKVVYAIRYLQRETHNKLNILLIVDDIKTRQKATIQELFTNGRNSNITIMNLVQHPTMVDNHIRTNCKFIFLFNQKNPELIRATTEKFLMNFVKTPELVKTHKDKLLYLENWLQKNTENYTSVVLNIKSGKIQKIKANY